MRKIWWIVLLLCYLWIAPNTVYAQITSETPVPDWQSGAWQYKFIPAYGDDLRQLLLWRDHNVESKAYTTLLENLAQNNPEKIQFYLNDVSLKRVPYPYDVDKGPNRYSLTFKNPYIFMTFPTVNDLPHARLRIEVTGAESFELAFRDFNELRSDMNNPSFYDILFYSNHPEATFIAALPQLQTSERARYITDAFGRLIDPPDENTLEMNQPLYFKGWYDAEKPDILMDLQNHQFKKDAHLYAHWSDKAPINISFDLNGGSWDHTITLETEEGELLPDLPEPKRAHYQFRGWFWKNEVYPLDKPLTESMTLTAQWQPIIHDVTFDLAGGSWSLPLTYSVHEGATLNITETPTKAHHQFLGWFQQDTPYNLQQPVLENTRLTAHWKAKDYYIYLDANGGNLAGNSRIKLSYQETLNELPLPVRKKYRFIGWYNKAGELLTTIKNPEKDYYLKARWQRKAPSAEPVPLPDPADDGSKDTTLEINTNKKMLKQSIEALKNAPYLSLHPAIQKAQQDAATYLEKTNLEATTLQQKIQTLQTAKTHLDDFSFKPFISGYPNNRFQPQKAVTRAEFAAMLYKLFDRPEVTLQHSPFQDINGHWAEKAILYLEDLNWLPHYQKSYFNPQEPISRGEMAYILAHYPFVEEATNKFTLKDIENHWARDSIVFLHEKNIIAGYPNGSFHPNGTLSRAEITGLLAEAFHLPQQYTQHTFNDVAVNHWAFASIQKACIPE